MKNTIIGIVSVLLFGIFMTSATEKDQRGAHQASDPVVVDLLNHDPEQLSVNTVGTGRTTGHILNLEVKNLTDRDMEIHYTPVFIPSDGKHQPYIVPESGTIRVPGGSTVVHPMDGYCADNGKPPLGPDSGAPSIDNWQSPNPDYFDDEGLDPSLISVSDDPVFGNGKPVFDPLIIKPSDLIRILRELVGGPSHPPRPMPVAPDEYNYASLREVDPADHVINIPTNVLPRSNQDKIFEPTNTGYPLPIDVSVLKGKDFPFIDLDFNAEPENTANLLYDAIIKITNVVNEMVETGIYDYPFPTEEVIQQTFWIYTGTLRETPYEFEDFREKMAVQYESIRGVPLSDAPQEEVEQFNEGVENFWGGFQIIGQEAKVIKSIQGVKTKETTVPGVYTPPPAKEFPPMPWDDMGPEWDETLITWDWERIWEEQQEWLDEHNRDYYESLDDEDPRKQAWLMRQLMRIIEAGDNANREAIEEMLRKTPVGRAFIEQLRQRERVRNRLEDQRERQEELEGIRDSLLGEANRISEESYWPQHALLESLRQQLEDARRRSTQLNRSSLIHERRWERDPERRAELTDEINRMMEESRRNTDEMLRLRREIKEGETAMGEILRELRRLRGGIPYYAIRMLLNEIRIDELILVTTEERIFQLLLEIESEAASLVDTE